MKTLKNNKKSTEKAVKKNGDDSIINKPLPKKDVKKNNSKLTSSNTLIKKETKSKRIAVKQNKNSVNTSNIVSPTNKSDVRPLVIPNSLSKPYLETKTIVLGTTSPNKKTKKRKQNDIKIKKVSSSPSTATSSIKDALSSSNKSDILNLRADDDFSTKENLDSPTICLSSSEQITNEESLSAIEDLKSSIVSNSIEKIKIKDKNNSQKKRRLSQGYSDTSRLNSDEELKNSTKKDFQISSISSEDGCLVDSIELLNEFREEDTEDRNFKKIVLNEELQGDEISKEKQSLKDLKDNLDENFKLKTEFTQSDLENSLISFSSTRVSNFDESHENKNEMFDKNSIEELENICEKDTSKEITKNSQKGIFSNLWNWIFRINN